MRDIKQRIEKLRVDAEDCILISKLATAAAKREIFQKLAEEYQRMARELEERVASGNLTGDLGI
jgi:CRISPR/Cas system-associated endoribonuclease Cas2